MPRTKSTTAPDAGARDAARTKRADLVREAQLAEEAQMTATIAAVEDRIANLGTGVPETITVKGNQGRP
jgi:hypothetical protein